MKVPGAKLYGPYHHQGRHALVWTVRGKALREGIIPFLRRHSSKVDSHIRDRITNMIERYGL